MFKVNKRETMNIKDKLRRLLLASSLFPLLISSSLLLALLLGLGGHFANDIKTFLVKQSHSHLQTIIQDSEILVRKNFQLVDWVLDGQAYVVKQRKRKEKSTNLQQEDQSDLSKNSSLFAGSPPSEMDLSSLGKDFQLLRKKAPELISRQYVTFTSGPSYFLSSVQEEMVPIDLSGQRWLEKILKSHRPLRFLVDDVPNHSLSLVVGTSLQDSEGTIWGATAVEVPLANLISSIVIPETWQSGATVMLASLDRNPERVSIVAKAVNGSSWQLPFEEKSSPAFLDASVDIVAGVKAGHTGVLMIKHQDRIRHWAYGPLFWDEFFPLIMLEHDPFVSLALESEQHVLSKTRWGVAIVGVVLLMFVGLSYFAAGHFSLVVTEPVRKLTCAFNQLARGVFATRVDITTGDEIEELGRRFNALGGELEDRNRMAHSLALAREVQQYLLPGPPPIISGMDFFSHGIPCDEVGGDYYDFISQEDKSRAQIGVVVGDVSGHGVPAALLMASTRGILRSHSWCHGGDLNFLFQLLNQHLTKDSDSDHFMTLFYGILDRERGALRWNSAGHGPILLYQSRSHSFKVLGTTGPPLGIDDKFSYEPLMLDNLETGDFLLAGTDGLWESRNEAGEAWGLETVKNTLLKVTTSSASEIGQFLLAELLAFSDGHRQEDDISLVIVKLT